MQLNVTAVMIPQKKEGWKEGDLCKRIALSRNFPNEEIGFLFITFTDYDSPNPHWQAQHLYILSDREIKAGDWYMDDAGQVRQPVTLDADYWAVRKHYKRIEAAHPEISGTPAISAEFLALYAEKGGSVKGLSMEMETRISGDSIHPICDISPRLDQNGCVIVGVDEKEKEKEWDEMAKVIAGELESAFKRDAPPETPPAKTPPTPTNTPQNNT